MKGRLVAPHRFTENWPSWEVHPHGAELVLCAGGEIELIQEVGGEEQHIPLRKGDYAINPPGVWHSANVVQLAEVLFITVGHETENRPRTS